MRFARNGAARGAAGAAPMLFAALLAAGCSSNGGPPLPETVPARGTVTLSGGQPLKGGRVVLSPKTPGALEAFGDVRPDGTFTVQTYKPGDGAVPGSYVATISPYDYGSKTGSPTRLSFASQIPAKYGDAATSGLEVEVREGEANDLRLRLR